jgi:hypothetical protein
MTYRASLDTLNKFSTIVVIVLLVVIGGSTMYISYASTMPVEAQVAFCGTTILVVAALAISYGYSPKSYSLTNDSLVINRPFKPAVYSLADITEVQQLEKSIWTGSIRLFGAGGFFGYYGNFWNRKIGSYTAYGTRIDNKILITLKGNKKILLTPDSLEMLEELKKRIV